MEAEKEDRMRIKSRILVWGQAGGITAEMGDQGQMNSLGVGE